MTTFLGRCHCGNIEVVLETALTPEQLPLRACGCSFCRRHRARTTADPKGRARITVHDPAPLAGYRFAHATADFLVCRVCGVYVAAVLSDGGSAWAILNVNAFDDQAAFWREAMAVVYDGESPEARRARRRRQWTPAEITTGGRAAG